MTTENNVYIDIETIPSQEPWVREYCDETVKPPGTLKKPESIQKWMEEDRDDAINEAIDKMGFDGSSNHIISIGVAIGENPAVSFDTLDIAGEKKIIEDFYTYVTQNTTVTAPTFIGHNISGFDLKIIRQRTIIMGVTRPTKRHFPFTAKPWDTNPFDTMVQWDPKNYIKLDRLARAFGIQGKDGMDGSKVYGAWKEGRIEEIAKYCREDVEMTRAVYKRMVGLA
ncbi:MAG: ribonuclease H-like domain-containing protein [Kiritimatiellia bacterium]